MVELDQLPTGNLQTTCKVLIAAAKLEQADVDEIMRVTGLSEAQVRSAVQALIKAGKLASVPKFESYPDAKDTRGAGHTKYRAVSDWTPDMRSTGRPKKTKAAKKATRDEMTRRGFVRHRFEGKIRNLRPKLALLNWMLEEMDDALSDRQVELLKAIAEDYGRERAMVEDGL